MKLISNSKLLLLAGALVASCTSDELGIPSSTKVSKIVATISNFEEDTDEGITRTSYSYDSSRGYEAVWAEGDILGIYPVGGDQVAFPLSEGIGTASASFNGGAWALKGTYRYAAYYPFSTDNYTIPETEIPVSYLGQKQTGNNTTAHFAAYDYMAAAATQPNAAGVVTLPFEHLGTYLVFPLTLPKAGTYTKLTLTSSVGEFITEGTIDLSATKPAITATATSSTISMDLDNIVLTAANQVLTVNMLIAPVNLTGSTITISVTDSNGDTYSNTEKAWTRSAAFEPNKTSRVSRTLSYSGTSGTIEGGGGVEDDDEADPFNGHEYVDLGLPSGTLWATCNVGANSPEEFGGYYAWGEIEEKEVYSWDNYKWGKYNAMTKYCDDARYGQFDNVTSLESIDDVATQIWGTLWEMPTFSQWQELYNICTWTWKVVSNVYGYAVKGPNGNSIFLPAAGQKNGTYFDDLYPNGLYLSSNLGTSGSIYCNVIQFIKFPESEPRIIQGTGFDRKNGASVRPVRVKQLTNMHNGHEYVDLGVVVDGKPVYWATMNIGAESPADHGLYFAWGETVGYGSSPQGEIGEYGAVEILDGRNFSWSSYSSDLYSSGGGLKKYCTDDNKVVLDSEDDVARVNWQSSWRMPTQEEQEALRTQCTWTWTTMTNSAGESINGYKVSNKTDSSKFIFLPNTGLRINGILGGENSDGYYWSSSLSASDSYNAYCLHFGSSGIYDWNNNSRCYGQSVRPVYQ